MDAKRNCPRAGPAETAGPALPNGEWTIQLRDGSTMDGRAARAISRTLVAETDVNPMRVAMLHRVARGVEEASEQLRKELGVSAFDCQGNMHRNFKLLLLNMVTQTSNGVKLANPFAADSWTQHVIKTIDDNEPCHVGRLAVEIDQVRDHAG